MRQTKERLAHLNIRESTVVRMRNWCRSSKPRRVIIDAVTLAIEEFLDRQGAE